MNNRPTITILITLFAITLLTALPVGASANPCTDPATSPAWCEPTPTSPPEGGPIVTLPPTPIVPTPASTPGIEPAPAPAPYPAPYPAPHEAPTVLLGELTKPWRLFGLTATQWGELLPFERQALRQER